MNLRETKHAEATQSFSPANGLQRPGGARRSGTGRFSEKPIRVVLPFASGSGSDASLRYVTSKIGQATAGPCGGNKPGGNSFIGVHDFMRASADGYTLLYSGGTTHGVNSALFKQLPYDPVKDMVPVVLWCSHPWCCWHGLPAGRHDGPAH
jgi:tripartite-type tricarboxylate transporter receptor subunit TctC